MISDGGSIGCIRAFDEESRWCDDNEADLQSYSTGRSAEAKRSFSSATPDSSAPLQPTPQSLQQVSKRSRVLYTANVGDARCVLCRSGKALRLSYDHKGSDENEGKRIANAGGLILNNRVNGVLAVTRALGDAYLKDLVTGHPYTTETVIQSENDELLILACDGVSRSDSAHVWLGADDSVAVGRVFRPRGC